MHRRLSSKMLVIIALCSSTLLASCMRASAQDDGTRWALVNVSDCFMRAEPRYGSECVSQTRMGTLVQILERKGYWARIKTPDPYEGWVNELALAPTRNLSAEEQKSTGVFGATLDPLDRAGAEKYLRAPKLVCVSMNATVYAGPVGGETVTTLLMSDMVCVPGKARAGNGGRRLIVLPDGREGWVSRAAMREMHSWAEDEAAESDSVKIADIIRLARSFVGAPYMWGGMSAGHFDCSGLTSFCFFMNGILLPRDASQQVKCGIEVPFEDMKAGDLVFFGNTSVGHVALCIGNHKIIHASQIVRINSLVPGEKDYYGRNILHIRRILGHETEGELKAVPVRDSPSYF